MGKFNQYVDYNGKVHKTSVGPGTQLPPYDISAASKTGAPGGLPPLDFILKPGPATFDWSKVRALDTAAYYQAAMNDLKSHPLCVSQKQWCDAFGFLVDPDAYVSLGYGSRSPCVKNPATTLKDQMIAMLQFFSGVAHAAADLSNLYYPPDPTLATYLQKDINAGRLAVKNITLVTQAMNKYDYEITGDVHASLDYDGPNYRWSILEAGLNKAVFCPTDDSLRILCGKQADDGGNVIISAGTLAWLVLSQNLGAYQDQILAPDNRTLGQLQYISDAGVFTPAQLKQFKDVGSAAAQAYGNAVANSFFGGLFQSPAFANVAKSAQDLVKAITMEVTLVKLGGELEAAGIVVAGAILTAGAATPAAATATAAIATTGAAATKAVTSGQSVVPAILPGVTQAAKSEANDAVKAAGGGDVDLFGVNVGVDTGSVGNALSSIGSAVIPPGALDGIIPQSITDAAAAAASVVTVAPSATPSTVPAKPAAAPAASTATKIVSSPVTPAALGALGLAAFYFLKK